MKNIVIISTFLVSLTSLSQVVEKKTEVAEKKLKVIYGAEEETIPANEHGNIILIANYDNGLVTGSFQKFHENGNLMEEGEYIKMKKVGVWKYYDENGILLKTEQN